MPDTRLLMLIAKLADANHRAECARELARYIGVDDLILFVHDTEVNVLLPAPGFPQTLPGGRRWPDFLATCVAPGEYRAELPSLESHELTPALALVALDRSVMVLLGGEADADHIANIRILLPLLSSAFTGEQATQVADAHALVATQEADRANKLIRSLDTARQDLGLALKREQSARQDLAFLAEASAALSGSLDYEATLKHLAEIIVPYLADCCAMVITSGDEAQTVNHVEVACSIAEKRQPLEHLTYEYVVHRREPSLPIVRSLQMGVSEIQTDALSEQLRHAIDQRDWPALEALRMYSLMTTPLQARGRMLGVIVFISAESNRRYRERDLVLAQELAQRAALAVDNALLYRDAQNAIRDRENFLSVAAHELKTPITSLRAFAQLIRRNLQRDGEISAERLEQTIEMFERQTEKLMALSTQLLDFSRIETGYLELEKTATDLVALSYDVAMMAQSRTKKHTIQVIAPDRAVAVVDSLRMEQVLTNLVDNAIRYSPDGGEITIQVSMSAPDQVSISVSDNGIGISSEDRDRIFERFYQTTDSSHYGGMGLGLYISHEIVRLHAGQIEVESIQERGTCFIVTLPTGMPDSQPSQTAVADEATR